MTTAVQEQLNLRPVFKISWPARFRASVWKSGRAQAIPTLKGRLGAILMGQGTSPSRSG